MSLGPEFWQIPTAVARCGYQQGSDDAPCSRPAGHLPETPHRVRDPYGAGMWRDIDADGREVARGGFPKPPGPPGPPTHEHGPGATCWWDDATATWRRVTGTGRLSSHRCSGPIELPEETPVSDSPAYVLRAAAAAHREETQDVARWFAYDHLPAGPARATSAWFWRLAVQLLTNLLDDRETTVALRKLLEAKDAAVRAAIAPSLS